jgi:ArsR family transcriptional regulator
MKALSDPKRVTIVKLLLRRKMCVSDIQTALNIPQSSVSKHLKILANAGLVTRSKDGQWVNYRCTDGGTSPYASTLLGNLRHWLEDDMIVSKVIEKVSDIQSRGESQR